jgi:hypothetical protein
MARTTQDSSDPTGVVDGRHRNTESGSEAAKLRNRKADAAMSMRLSGANWSEIALVCGYPTPRAALSAVEKALVRRLDDTNDRDLMRKLAGMRLERLLRGVWTKAIDPDNPEHLAAVQRGREIIDRHAKLFGLDAPAEIVIHSPTQGELEDWVLRVTSTIVQPVEEPDIFEAELVEDLELEQ